MPLLNIDPHDITLIATFIQVDIDEFVFVSHIRLKISYFNSNNVFLLYDYVVIGGQDYIDMNASGNSDLYIKNFVETQLGVTINI